MKFAVYDIESIKNCFLCCIYDLVAKEMVTIEVSERKNELSKIRDHFLSGKYIYVGYNNISYDGTIINYILTHFNGLINKDYKYICSEINNVSNVAINGEQIALHKYRYMNKFPQIDLLTMLFSKKLRVSLKEMQVTMCYPNVQEMEHDWSKELDVSQIDALVGYCHNDVLSTTELLRRSKPDLQLRKDIRNQYKIECMSKDGVSLGAELLKIEYCKFTGESPKSYKTHEIDYDTVDLKNCISPLIHYTTPILKEALEKVKAGRIDVGVNVKSDFAFDIVWNGLKYTYGLGGMHTVNNKEIHKEDKDWIIIDADVDSYYPSMIIEYGFYPKYLGYIFLELYKEKRDDRLAAKKLAKTDPAMKLKSEVFKLLLNSTFGNMGSGYSWLFDPKEFFSITLTGQLAIMMLNERLVNIGCVVISSNTDGTTVKVPRDKVDEYYKVCEEWSKYTKLGLEFAQYERMYIYAVNDYIAIKKGYSELPKDTPQQEKSLYIKEKGIFLRSPRLGKGLDSLIIGKSLVNYFADGTPIEETINNSSNIWDFIKFEKTGKQFTVYWNDQKQQRTNRFYVSKKAPYLYKGKFVDKYNPKTGRVDTVLSKQNMLSGYGVQIFNVYEEKSDMKDYNINYSYYISEARKIITEMEPKQLMLF